MRIVLACCCKVGARVSVQVANPEAHHASDLSMPYMRLRMLCRLSERNPVHSWAAEVSLRACATRMSLA